VLTGGDVRGKSPGDGKCPTPGHTRTQRGRERGREIEVMDRQVRNETLLTLTQ